MDNSRVISQEGENDDAELEAAGVDGENTTEVDLKEIKVDTKQIVQEGREFLKRKKHAITESLDRIGGSSEINGLLDGDDKKSAAAKTETNKRGPRINEDVQVKICDMGNGCWSYHHFTPEI